MSTSIIKSTEQNEVKTASVAPVSSAGSNSNSPLPKSSVNDPIAVKTAASGKSATTISIKEKVLSELPDELKEFAGIENAAEEKVYEKASVTTDPDTNVELLYAEALTKLLKLPQVRICEVLAKAYSNRVPLIAGVNEHYATADKDFDLMLEILEGEMGGNDAKPRQTKFERIRQKYREMIKRGFSNGHSPANIAVALTKLEAASKDKFRDRKGVEIIYAFDAGTVTRFHNTDLEREAEEIKRKAQEEKEQRKAVAKERKAQPVGNSGK